MKNLIFLLTFLNLISCKDKNGSLLNNEIKKNKIEVNKIKNVLNKKEVIYSIIKDTLKIDKSFYFVIQDDPRSEINRNLVILNDKSDTIYKHDGFASNGFEFEDFDKDGTLDIRLNQISNTGGLSELIIFDKKTKEFRNVEDFTRFFEPTKLKKTKLWYSYHRSGCADINWDSDLFYIQNFKAVRIGNISGKGCENEPKNGIFINKIIGDKKVLIKEIIREEGYYGDKWEFIEKYWNENFKKFK